MTDIIYCFQARDEDVGTDLNCLVTLAYAPSDSATQFSATSNSLSATFVLGEFHADDISKQAYDWFMGQHGVSIDSNSLRVFLTSIQDCTITQFISVRMDIVPTSYSPDTIPPTYRHVADL